MVRSVIYCSMGYSFPGGNGCLYQYTRPVANATLYRVYIKYKQPLPGNMKNQNQIKMKGGQKNGNFCDRICKPAHFQQGRQACLRCNKLYRNMTTPSGRNNGYFCPRGFFCTSLAVFGFSSDAIIARYH